MGEFRRATSGRSRRGRRSWVLRKVRAARLLAQEQFRLAFEEAPIGLALVSVDGRFLRVNAALCQLLGFTEEELLATTFQAITHPEDLEADLALASAVLAGEMASYRMEKRYVRRDGSVVEVQLDVSLVRGDTGQPLHFMSQIQDVTERNRSIEALHATQAIQAASLDALEQGVVVVDVKGEVKLLNRAGCEILGCRADELASRWHERWETFHEDGDVVPFDDRPIVTTLRTGTGVEGVVGCWRSPEGTIRTLRIRTEPIWDDEGTMTGVVAAFADITDQRVAERAEQMAIEELEWRANHDALTELPNRGVLLDRLDEVMGSGGSAAVLFVDLDHFKAVNDTLGHESGDELLKEVAARIVKSVRSGDTVARFGGDEFVVLAEGASSLAAAEDLADRVAAAVTQPLLLSGGPVEISASIGIAFGRAVDAAALLRRADVALYRAKAEGRDRSSVCEKSA